MIFDKPTILKKIIIERVVDSKVSRVDFEFSFKIILDQGEGEYTISGIAVQKVGLIKELIDLICAYNIK